MEENSKRRRVLGEEAMKAEQEAAKKPALDPEAMLKTGVCPKCNQKIGRGVRLHYASCE